MVGIEENLGVKGGKKEGSDRNQCKPEAVDEWGRQDGRTMRIQRDRGKEETSGKSGGHDGVKIYGKIIEGE